MLQLRKRVSTNYYTVHHYGIPTYSKTFMLQEFSAEPLNIFSMIMIRIIKLIKLYLFPLTYMYDLCDILFFIKSIQNPSEHFDIQLYTTFANTSSSNKLQHVFTSNNHLYFYRLPRTFNSLPVINLNQSFNIIKSKITKYLWQHFS